MLVISGYNASYSKIISNIRMKQTLSAYWQFLKKPKLIKLSKDNKSLWRDLTWLLVLDLIFAGLVMCTYYMLLHFRVIKEYVDEVDILKRYGLTGALLMACILAPLVEESLFRWMLRKSYATIYFICFTLSIITLFLVDSTYLTLPICIFFLLVSFVFHGYFKRMGMRKKHMLWQKSYGYIFYYSAIIFGFIHFKNIKGLTLSDPAFVLFVISQAFTGLSLGYLRIKYGLVYSILLHGFFNFIGILLSFFFS